MGNASWYAEMMREYEEDGRADAALGIYQPPYAFESEPDDADANQAYLRGFNARRKELGEKFKWA